MHLNVRAFEEIKQCYLLYLVILMPYFILQTKNDGTNYLNISSALLYDVVC